MAIQFIDNQPIDFRASLPSDSPCKVDLDCTDFCAPYQIGDPIQFQYKYTPCDNTNHFCNPSLINENPELVTNGDFTTNPSLNWTIGTGWAWDLPNKVMKRNSTSSGSLSQTIAGLSNGTTYIVTFKITARFGTSNLTVSLGGTTYGSSFDYSGTYSILITAGAGTTLSFTSNKDVWTLDAISVKKHIISTSSSDCLYVDSSATFPYWTQPSDGSISHILGDSNSLYTSIAVANSTGYVKIKFKVSGYGGTGNFNLNYWNNVTSSYITIATITGDGDYEFYCQYYLTLGSTSLKFSIQPGADCSFTLSDIGIYDLTTTASIMLINDANGQVYSYPQLYYDREYVTAKFDTTGFLEGQYRICVYDLCSTLPSSDLEMVEDPVMLNCNWILPNLVSSCSTTSHKLTLTVRNNLTTYDFYPITWSSHIISNNQFAKYYFDIKTASITSGVQMRLDLVNLFDGSTLCNFTDDLQASTEITGYVTILKGSTMQPAFRLVCSSLPTDLGIVEFLKLSLIEKIAYPASGTGNCSNCIDLRTTQKCTNWIQGECDQEAFGFNFTHFSLAGRVRSMFINPKYKGSISRYGDAGGDYTVTKASSGKHYQFLIDYSPERTHDWLRLAVLCDQIKIGSSSLQYKTWVNTEGDYTPEWPDNLGNYPFAQCRLELQEKIDELYNNNAG